MSADLKAYWLADKELSIEPDWKSRGHDEFARLVSPLDINGVTIEGLRFTVSAHIYAPDRCVTFQIEFESMKHPRGVPFVRFEWRPISPHNNKNVGPKEFRLIDISETHIHPFDLNWDHSQSAVRKGVLPIAIPVSQTIESYNEATLLHEHR